MNPNAGNLSPAILRLLNEYIDAVERQLTLAGKTRTDRRRICDDLEGQIREMLAERTLGSPTEADLRAVLAELDKPEAYGERENSEEIKRLIESNLPYSSQAANLPQSTIAASTPTTKRSIFAIMLVVGGVMLLVVVAIIAIMASITVPNFLEAQIRSKVSRVRADQRSLVTAIEAYFTDNRAYPAWTTQESSAFGSMASLPTLQGQPTFRNRDLAQSHTLTTPVAYITSYFGDQFSPLNRAPFCYYSDYQNWFLWSAGPDGRYDLNLDKVRALIDPNTHQVVENKLVELQYDPSNGTKSAGDVIRHK